MSKDRLIDILGSFYIGGAVGTWLSVTWYGFTEFPLREIGAALWPILMIALLGGISE